MFLEFFEGGRGVLCKKAKFQKYGYAPIHSDPDILAATQKIKI
jgi:hypothetical protein